MGVLFGFSFVWPHLKLFLMHLVFYLPLTSRARRNGNYWLAFWGKWSLADALVMCCLIGLFNLSINMDLVEVWSHFHHDLDSLCLSKCRELANEGSDHGCEVVCTSIDGLLAGTAFNHDALPSSNVFVNLRVSGLIAMYSFCVAVILSLGTGVIIENLDEELREKIEESTPVLQPLESLSAVTHPSCESSSNSYQLTSEDSGVLLIASRLSERGGEAPTSRAPLWALQPLSLTHSVSLRARAEANQGVGLSWQLCIHSILVRTPHDAARTLSPFP
ncbi:MAG: hypothetical protein SGPRY_003936 [Prymnesium sp.]